MSVLPSKENTSKDIKTDKVKWKDVKQLRSKITQSKSTQSGRVEIELRQQCLQYGVRYIDREKDESRKKCMKRRKLMREHIQNTHVSSKNNKIMENNGDDIDFLVEFPDKDGNSTHAPSMEDQNEMKVPFFMQLQRFIRWYKCLMMVN